MLNTGDKAHYFKWLDKDGKEISLGDFEGKKLILYFYPKDSTPGCTAETCSLRNEYTERNKSRTATNNQS